VCSSDLVAAMAGRTTGRVVTYGLGAMCADVWASNDRRTARGRMEETGISAARTRRIYDLVAGIYPLSTLFFHSKAHKAALSLADIRDGMLAAVLYGTARRSYEGDGEQPLGKTGTCSDSASRVGWFVSYADQQHPKIVLAVLIRGQSGAIKGAMAAQIAGHIYKRLNDVNYFANKTSPANPSGLAAKSSFTSTTSTP
jgi:hypothetical protein